MAYTDLSLHGVTDIKIESVYANNNMSLGFIFQRDGSWERSVGLTVFGLSPDLMNRLIATFGEPERYSYSEHQSIYPAEMKALRAENERLKAELSERTVQAA